MIDFATITNTIASTARRVLTASISGAGDSGDSGTSERVDGCEVVQPLGLYARPVLSTLTEALVARHADKPVILAIMDKGRSAQAVEEGEVRLYGPGSANAAAVIRIRANGAIEVTSVTNTNITIVAGGTGVVVMQNGSQAFIRGNDYSTVLSTFLSADNTFLSALATVFGALSTYAIAIQPIADPTNTATPVLTGAIATIVTAITTRTTAGTAFSNSSSTWLSTRVTGQ